MLEWVVEKLIELIPKIKELKRPLKTEPISRSAVHWVDISQGQGVLPT